jgi:hypothetical protein
LRETLGVATHAERLKEVTARALKVAMSHGDEEFEVSPIDFMMLTMFGRVRSLLQAVNILLGRNLPEEAMILGRELFTDSLQLAELARHDVQGRAALILGVANQSLTEWEQMESTARSIDPDHETPPAMTKEIAARRRNIQAGMSRFGLAKLRRFPHEKQLATTNGRLDDFMDFELSHRFVHRADMAQVPRTKKVKDSVGIHLGNRDEEWKARVGAFAAQSALHAFVAAATILGWSDPGPEDARRLLEQLAEIAEEESTTSRRPSRSG